MDTSSIFPQVRAVVADVLAVNESKVKPEGSLIDDYGAESIDFLDLVYRLEREFKVKIPRGQIEKDARGAMADEEFAENGRLTEKGMARVREYLSEVPARNVREDRVEQACCGLPRVDERDDIRMVELGAETHFAPKTLGPLRGFAGARVLVEPKHLDGDILPGGLLGSLVDGSEATRPDRLSN